MTEQREQQDPHSAHEAETARPRRLPGRPPPPTILGDGKPIRRPKMETRGR